MKSRCWICCKDLSSITTTVQANLINNTETWRDYWEKKEHIFFFPTINKSTCLSCFKNYTSWIEHPKKLFTIRNREITSIKPKLVFPIKVKYDKCAICKTETEYPIHTSIFKRQYYLSGLGQFCCSCYMATTNTSMVMREWHQDYLF